MTDHIVVSDHVLLDINTGAARARLGILARDGVLLGASEEAYGEGITGLVQLAGPAAGRPRVGLENLAETDRRAHIALQWEAIAADGKLFAALDADLMLVPAGDQTTALALAGAYGCSLARLAPGWTGRSCASLPRRRPAASWPGWRVRLFTPRARQDRQAAAHRGGRWGTTSHKPPVNTSYLAGHQHAKGIRLHDAVTTSQSRRVPLGFAGFLTCADFRRFA